MHIIEYRPGLTPQLASIVVGRFSGDTLKGKGR